MPIFKYTAKTEEGKEKKGKVEAPNRRRAVEILQEQGLVVTALSSGERKISLPFLGGVSGKEKMVFTRQLATMMASGLPITQALSVLAEQAKGSRLGEILEEVRGKVEGGTSLHDSLAAQGDVFSSTYIHLVSAGEASGNLDEVLERLAENMERSQNLRSEIKGAMIYPIIVLVAMVGVFFGMMIFVVPRLKEMYETMGATLPFLTQIFMGFSDFLINFWWVVILAVLGLILLFRVFKETEQGKLLLARLSLTLPVVGTLNQQVKLAELTRTLALLSKSGVPILEALGISKGVAGNVLYEEALSEAARRVEQGSSLSQPFEAKSYFPPLVPRMLRVGEETGELPQTLYKLSSFFESEAAHTIKGLTSAMEPVIMLILGAMVGVLIFSIIMPIYNLTSQF